MMARGADAWTAQQRALSLLNRQLDAQASVISYSKIYMLSALLILALIPLLALVRVGRSASGTQLIAD
jgi:DHA2 family multidrug resistance protein